MQVGKLALPAAAFAMILVGVQAARAQGAAGLDNASCLSCHGEPGFAVPGANGQIRSLYVSADHFAHSVHGALQCAACHATITEIPHNNPPLTPAQWRQQIPRLCGSCHTTALNDYLNSVHGKQVMGGGNVNAAVCTDCHGANGIGRDRAAPNLTGQSQDYLAAALKAYAGGTRNHVVMNALAKGASGEDVDRLAAYYAGASCK